MIVTSGERIPKTFELAAELVLKREGIDPHDCEISVSFIESEGIRALNARYRGKDEATDVLSFPMCEGTEGIRAAIMYGAKPALLGDVVICGEIAKRQADEYGHSAARELNYLFVHGMLHLLGYNHETEEEKRGMRDTEEELLKELNLNE